MMTENDSLFEKIQSILISRESSMFTLLKELVLIQSGSYNKKGVDEVTRRINHVFKNDNVVTEIIEQTSLGNHLVVRSPSRSSDGKQVLFVGHTDTVFPADTDFNWYKEDDSNCYGPGVIDMKGGLVVGIFALKTLGDLGLLEQIPLAFIFNSDEEIGSPISAQLLEQSAKRNHLGLIYEPTFPDGSLAAERKGSGYFTAVVRGKAAHAGRDPHLGRNAIRAMADLTQAIDDLNGQRDGVTINAGFIQGGGPVNIVPDLAILKFNVRIARPDDEIWVQKELDKAARAINVRDGLSLELHGQFVRKPKILSKANRRLIHMIGECGADLGMKLQ